MKKRIQIDSALLSFLVILTGFLYLNKGLYWTNRSLDNVLDFLGIMAVLKGTLLRMAARGHKKTNSAQGESLVMTGPYTLVRNPMYLGSFLMGVGFILIVWPWWSLPIFAVLFYLRFNQQIVKEEEHLSRLFGADYAAYCQKTPRLFPSLKRMGKVRIKEVFNFKEALNTKEKRALLGWPLLAVVLETFQESIVFGRSDLVQTVNIFLGAMVLFAIVLWILYNYV